MGSFRLVEMRTLLVAVVLLAITTTILAFDSQVYGVDVSTPVSKLQFQCLNGDNLTFAVIRCWHSTGTPDTNAPGTVAAAWAGGLAHVDVYMFPCPSCGNPSGQVADAVSYLKQHGTKWGTFWLISMDLDSTGDLINQPTPTSSLPCSL